MYSHRVSCSGPVRRGRLWTHGTIIGTGNHSHHNKSYMIQLTTNGTHITCNRHHAKPTTVTEDAYIQYHSTKQQNSRTDPPADILNNITKNPVAYATIQMPNITGQPDKKQKEEARTKNKIVPKQQTATGIHVQMI